jgi:leucyl aminopeptidase
MSPQASPPRSSPAPSIDEIAALTITVDTSVPSAAGAVGMLVAAGGEVPAALGLDRARLQAAGFDGEAGQSLVVPTAKGPTMVAVGIGDGDLDATAVRNAAATFARAATAQADVALVLPAAAAPGAGVAAQAAVEGITLARYRYHPLLSAPKGTALASITLVADGDEADDARLGAERGRTYAGVTMLARDLANSPHSHLTASDMADLAVSLGSSRGLDVQVFDEHALAELGCGGLLGVNAGSAEPARMVKLTYRPQGAAAGAGPRLSLVGKGIMYDSGGIALKPGDEVHSQMKNDMTGAAAVLASMSALAALDCPTSVTGYLMCSDNMPSGTAMALGDVITMHGGTTVEVVNTDAEGRLVMADALVMAAEEGADAIVDIATLTGACMRALGTSVAGVMGNDSGVIDQVRAAANATDEPVWELPLERRYRKELDSTIADLKNLGGANAGAITAALFLEEFVDGTPWAHIDIAGTAWAGADAGWQTAGCTGFGARLLLDLAVSFAAPEA